MGEKKAVRLVRRSPPPVSASLSHHWLAAGLATRFDQRAVSTGCLSQPREPSKPMNRTQRTRGGGALMPIRQPLNPRRVFWLLHSYECVCHSAELITLKLWHIAHYSFQKLILFKLLLPPEECVPRAVLYLLKICQLHPLWPSEMRITQLLHLCVNNQGIQTALMSNWLMFQLIYASRSLANYTAVEPNAVCVCMWAQMLGSGRSRLLFSLKTLVWNWLWHSLWGKELIKFRAQSEETQRLIRIWNLLNCKSGRDEEMRPRRSGQN